MRSSSSRVRIGWRTAETVSLSCVDRLVRTRKAWKARSGQGQGVVAGWSGRWIEYPTLSRILDPGHRKRVLESRVSCPSTKFKVAKKRKNGAKLDFAETRVSPSLFSQRKRAVWSGLGAGTCKSGMPIKWQFLQYPYRWVVARRSSIPLRLRRPSEPVTRFPAPQHYVLPRPMRSPRGDVFLQVEPRGGNS